MKYRTGFCFHVLFASVLCMALGCDKVTLPRLSHEEQPAGHSPVAVNLFLEEPVRNATLELQACDQPWQGHLGHAIATTFLDEGRKAFGEIRLLQSERPTEQSGEQPANLTVQLRLVNKSFGSGSRFGSENTSYAATMDVQLLAIYRDTTGTAVGQTPLTYHKAVNIWTPIIDSTGTCSTAQLDAEVETAAKTLARQMVSVVAKATAPPPGSPGGPQIAAGPIPSASPSPLTVQATLLDGNDNVILEAGEKIGLRIDVTNGGSTPVPAAQISLSGTSVLIDAFSAMLAAPIETGSIQPGATKSTLFWGKMPDSLEAQRGELTVTVMSGSASATQTLVSPIRPSTEQSSPVTKQSVLPAGDPAKSPPQARTRSTSVKQASVNTFGVLIGVNRYRDSLSNASPLPLTGLVKAADTLKQAGRIPGKQILLLRSEQATKTNMERAVTEWLPSRINRESLVFFYLSGKAKANSQTSEVFLVPYEGSADTTEGDLLNLHALQGSLKRIPAKVIVLLIDTPLTASGEAGQAKTAGQESLDWHGMIDPSTPGQPIPVIQIVSHPHSDFQAVDLLHGLEGPADFNKDGRVTLGELLDHVKSSANIFPLVPLDAPERNIVLTGT